MDPYLITGGAGFLGQRLARSLARSADVVAFDMVGEPRGGTRTGDNRVRFVQGNLLDTAALRELLHKVRPSGVVHLAAITGIARCSQSPDESFRTNVHGTYSVVKAISDAEVPALLVFASSREVYGETRNDSTVETAPRVPNNLYGLTKLLGEDIIRWAASKSKLRYTILRFTNLFGPGGDKYATSVFIRKALRGEDIEIMGGDQIFNLLYVDDAVRAIELCLQSKAAEGQAFNIGSKDSVTVRDLAMKILEMTGARVSLRQAPMRATEALRFIPNLEKSMRLLGFEASVTLDEGLRRTIEYCKQNL